MTMTLLQNVVAQTFQLWLALATKTELIIVYAIPYRWLGLWHIMFCIGDENQ